MQVGKAFPSLLDKYSSTRLISAHGLPHLGSDTMGSESQHGQGAGLGSSSGMFSDTGQLCLVGEERTTVKMSVYCARIWMHVEVVYAGKPNEVYIVSQSTCRMSSTLCCKML